MNMNNNNKFSFCDQAMCLLIFSININMHIIKNYLIGQVSILSKSQNKYFFTVVNITMILRRKQQLISQLTFPLKKL